MRQRYIVILSIFLLSTASSFTQSIILEVDKDAYVCDCQPDANNPGGPVTKLFQGPYYVGGHQCYARTASCWNLASLPQGCSITQATIEFKCTSTYGSLTGQMVFYRFLQDWGETTISSNNVPLFTSQDSIVKSWPAAGQWLSLDVTNLVRFWYEHPDSNFGLYGHCVNTTATNGAAAFNSSRYATSADRPKLTVTYTVTDIQSEGTVLPSDFQMEAYPNPFNPTTNIRFEIAQKEFVSLKIFDVLGHEIAALVNQTKQPGHYVVPWSAHQYPSGIYFISLNAGENRIVRKVALMK